MGLREWKGWVKGWGGVILIEDVNLLGGGVLLKELAGDFPLSGQDDAIGG